MRSLPAHIFWMIEERGSEVGIQESELAGVKSHR